MNEKNIEENTKSLSSKPTLRTPVFTQVFEQEKVTSFPAIVPMHDLNIPDSQVVEKARSTLSIYQRLLGGKNFVYQHL